jgi:glycosyltransferase involved in cell wall biosynthesis
MSKWLLNRGHRVTLLGGPFRESEGLLHKQLRFVEANDELVELCFYHRSKRVWGRLRIERPDVIKAFDLRASWIATVLASQITPAPKVLFVNYMPYIIPTSRNLLRNRTRRLFLLNLRWSLADDSILCMSREHIMEFQSYYGHTRSPQFWPLPVEDPSVNTPARTPKQGHIVSIGRLDPMKEYNIYMIDVVARLRRKGFPVTWTVFGDGVLRDEMKVRIGELDLREAIAMKGTIANSQVAATLHDAYVFVGMGTAIIEAALCGVPGVVALAYETSGLTYGPLYRFTFGNVGERMDAAPTTTVEAEIERVLKLSQQEYEEEVQRTREYAKDYEMDGTMERFLEIAGRASAPRASYALFYWYYLHSLGERLLQRMKAGIAERIPQSGMATNRSPKV